MSNVIQPQIRFPEFTTEWNKVPLKQVAKRQKEKNTENVHSFVLTNSATQGVVSQQDYFDKDIANQNNLAGYYIVETDDFVYNPRISEHAPVGPVKRNHLQTGVMSPLYTIFRFTDRDNDFFEYYFESTYWHKYLYSVANYGARHDRMNITNDDFEKLPIPVPEIEEQQKIAAFLKTIDKKITLLEEKKAQLEAYKQGMMQRLFPKKVGEQPELRFKDENGKMFEDWEEKRLGDVVTIKTGKKDVNEGNPNGIYPFFTCSTQYTYSDTYSFDTEAILIAGNGDVGHCQRYAGKFEAYQRTYVITDPHVNFDFLFVYLDYFFKNFVLRQKQVSAMSYIRIAMLTDFMIFLPSNDKEIQKIIHFVSLLDNKIIGVNEEIDQMKEWRSGLLQKMFV